MKLTAKAGTVTVEMKNPAGSGVPHGIAVEGHGVDQDGKIVQPGGTSTDTLTLKPGTYKFYCPVKGHEAAGMKGTLVVTWLRAAGALDVARRPRVLVGRQSGSSQAASLRPGVDGGDFVLELRLMTAV
jgi:hypothetical protein